MIDVVLVVFQDVHQPGLHTDIGQGAVVAVNDRSTLLIVVGTGLVPVPVNGDTLYCGRVVAAARCQGQCGGRGESCSGDPSRDFHVVRSSLSWGFNSQDILLPGSLADCGPGVNLVSGVISTSLVE